MQVLADFILFFVEVVTLVIAILFVFSGLISIANKNKQKNLETLTVNNLNEQYQDTRNTLNRFILDKKLLKKQRKENKKTDKEKKERKLFVIHFNGDIRASEVSSLRKEITAILTVASEKDAVLIIIESPGGIVPNYGLAASQLQRIRDANLYLTVAIDKVAASGGYLMACLANRIIAAPFAIIGSIGVVAQMPNFHDLLKKNHVNYEQLTSAEYKRTISLFGKNTDKGRKKLQNEIEETHQLFKAFIQKYRANVDIDTVATGEYWHAEQAIKYKLVDDIQTSDDYLLSSSKTYEIFEVIYQKKQPMTKKITSMAQIAYDKFLHQQQKHII